MALEPEAAFTWGAGGTRLTAEEITNRRKIADAMMKGDYSPVQHWTQGLARVVDGALGGLELRQLDAAARANAAESDRVVREAYGDIFPTAPRSVPPVASSTSMADSAVVPITPVASAPMPELDRVVRTVWGEAGNQPPAGQAAVAAVINNRAKQSGMTPEQVIMAKGQFEPWNNPAARARMERLDPASPEYQRIAATVTPIMSGAAPDPTGGATHFYAPKEQASLGRAAPSWDNGTGVDLGDHRFFKLGYGGSGRHGIPPQAQPSPMDTAQWPVGPVGAPTQVADDPATLPANATPTQGVTPQAIPSPGVVQVAQAMASSRSPAALMSAATNPYISESARKVAGMVLQKRMDDEKATHIDLGTEVGIMRGGRIVDRVAKTTPPIIVPEGGTAVDRNGRQLFQGAPKQTNDLREYETYTQQEKTAGRTPQDFTPWMRENKQAGATKLTVDQRSETEEGKERGKGLAKRLNDVADDGGKASEDALVFSRFGDLLNNVQTGSKTAILEKVRQMTGGAVNLDPNTDNVQALSAAIQYMAPRLRVPGSGSQSDRELSNFLNSIPALAGTPGGNTQILETLSGIIEHRRARAGIASEWQLGDITAKEAQKQMDAVPSPFAAKKPTTPAPFNGADLKRKYGLE